MVVKTVTCRAVTPIISRGLDYTKVRDYKVYSFELRPQSVKGVLHFWFRAVAPRVIDVRNLNFESVKDEGQRKKLQKIYGTLEYKGLMYLESLVFGSRECKAPFGLSVEYKPSDVVEIGRVEDGKFKINNLEFDREILYAVYGTYYYTKKVEEMEKNFVEKCLKANATFELKFYFKNEDVKEVIFSLLKLISVLGGLGAKTTKGFGQFEIKSFDDEDGCFDRSNYVTKEDILKLLGSFEDSLKKYIEKFDEKKLLILSKSGNVEFPNLLDESFEFSNPLVGSKRDWKEVMRELYRQNGWYRQLKRELRFFKKQNQRQDVVRKLINCLEGKEKEVDIFPAVLGLPLQYQRLKSRIEKVTFFPYVPGEEEDRGRKPSPLRIIINRGGNGWTAYALLLKSKITEEERLKYNIRANFQAKLTITPDEVWKIFLSPKKNRGVPNQ